MIRLVKVLIALMVVGAGSSFAAWYFAFKTDPAPRVTIKETPTVAAPGAALDGTYTVKPGNPGYNFVGYRVTEQFVANIVESTATGRTDDVAGTLTVRGTTVSNVTVTADLRSLTSDQGMRDDALRDEGLESGRFPQGKFVTTQPITLAAVPAVGETITTQATGEFTLHGVTRPVVITLQGRWDGTTVQVVGTLPIVFGDYNITAPTAAMVASVDDHAEMEFQFFFEKSIDQQNCAELAATFRDIRQRLALFPKHSTQARDATRDADSLNRRVDQLGGCPKEALLHQKRIG